MIQAIETQYKGYRFRSRLEARWAVFFDALNTEWEYEPEGFEADGMKYLPDFYIPRSSCYVEIKPGVKYSPFVNIYLAGKLRNTCWREELVNELRQQAERFWITGPDYIAHNDSNEDIVEMCLRQIDDADLVFANIDTMKSPGTLIELGYARAKGKDILINFKNETIGDLLWFAKELQGNFEIGASSVSMLKNLLPPLSECFKKCRMLSQNKLVCLMQGDPMNVAVTAFVNGTEIDWGTNLERAAKALFRLARSISVNDAAISARSARFEFGENG